MKEEIKSPARQSPAGDYLKWIHLRRKGFQLAVYGVEEMRDKFICTICDHFLSLSLPRNISFSGVPLKPNASRNLFVR